MNPKNENIRERLLSRLPQPSNLAAYREEVASMLEKKEKILRHEKWVAAAILTFMVALSVVFGWLGEQRLDTPKGPWFGTLACVSFLYGIVYLGRYLINQSRVDLLKEVKQVQVQVLELHALVAKAGAQTSSNP